MTSATGVRDAESIIYNRGRNVASCAFSGGPMIATRNRLNRSLHVSIFNYFIFFYIYITVTEWCMWTK